MHQLLLKIETFFFFLLELIKLLVRSPICIGVLLIRFNVNKLIIITIISNIGQSEFNIPWFSHITLLMFSSCQHKAQSTSHKLMCLHLETLSTHYLKLSVNIAANFQLSTDIMFV